MPYTRAKPVSAYESSEPSDEASKLEIYLQRQLEEDVARIFDESIYTDLEVVCGKLKILTHSCILKARTNQFYRKLKTILHVNIERDTFDEIYSFISDAYTECDIKNQESEIITYLQKKLQVFKSNHSASYKPKEEVELEVSSKCVKVQRIKSNPLLINKPNKGEIESDLLLTDKCVQKLKSNTITSYKQGEETIDLDVFLTPKCISPYSEKRFNKGSILSPSTELTKEYYALVPIEGNLLEQELNEQDALSNAFQSIIKTQDNSSPKFPPSSKPTSLFLSSSNFSKIVKLSNNCDNVHKSNLEKENLCLHNDLLSTQERKGNHSIDLEKSDLYSNKSSNNYSSGLETLVDPNYSPDSLIADDPSSSSDYLSAAYAGSPGLVSSGFFQLNVGHNSTKMENIFTSSDSGLENTGLLESLNSHKDITLTDVSLTDSTLHELTGDENQSHESACCSDKHQMNMFKVLTSRSDSSPVSGTYSEQSGSGLSQSPNKSRDIVKSSKEEKQRQNEEIVILESSSVSSETGSWESVFPPRLTAKEICETFINMERQFSSIRHIPQVGNNIGESGIVKKEVSSSKIAEQMNTNINVSSPHKSSACFIDAASLVDEEDDGIELTDTKETLRKSNPGKVIPIPSQPVPCSMVNKHDISPNDWSESNENDDSLEQPENKDQNSTQKDLSPTIFEMTPITEDSLISNPFEKATNVVTEPPVESEAKDSQSYISSKDGYVYFSSSTFASSTPYNSIMSLKTSSVLKSQSDSEECQYGLIQDQDNQTKLRKTRFNESSPIVSGGASIEDGKKEESMKLPINDCKKSPKTTSAATWVVDMSLSPVECNLHVKKPADKVYDSLKQESHFDNSENCNKSRGSVDSDSSEKSSHKFYIDLSSLPDPSPKNNDISSSTEKKNMFSIYIDLCDNSSLKGMPSRLSSSLNTKKPTVDKYTIRPNKVIKAPLSECIIPTFPKIFEQSDTSNFETYESLCNDPNISISEIIAISSDPSNVKNTVNEENSRDTGTDRTSNKSQSVNGENTLSTTGDVKQNISISDIIAISNASSHTKDTVNQENSRETGTDMTSNKSQSVHGENTCSTNSDSIQIISISEIIAISSDSSNTSNTVNEENSRDKGTDRASNKSQSVSGENIFSTTRNVIQEETSDDRISDLFVKLSDLDKPVYKPELPVLMHEHKDALDIRMTRSIPENNWGEQSHAVSSRSIEVISSFHSENALSLNRLFPHLKNEFSKSMPGSLSGRTRSPIRQGLSSSPGEPEEQVSDASEMSSVQSSICRSVVENSTTETSQTTSLIGNCQSRLGQDLLRMFLEEIAPDVIVEVSGKRIKAHKCILSSRCQYFAGILSGGWVESAGNVIVMPPFSFDVVHFALCHIYSGLSNIPDSVSIVELATLADMLGLEGLKEAIMFTLKAKYCHHFHRPCQVCTAGVLECFPLTSVYGLDDLYRKCLRWITKYFSKVWPTKAFATLPKELLDKCYQEHIVNFTIENIIDTVYGCGMTVTSLQNTRWAETVARLCRRLVNAAAHFAAPRLVAVLRAVGATNPDAPHAAKQALDDCLTAAIEWAPPDETCRAYAFLSNLLKDMRSQHLFKPDVINNSAPNKMSPQHNLLILHASSWRLQCEGALVRAAPRVVGTQAFKDLPPDLRKRLRELGCIMYGAQAIAINTSPFQDRRCRSTYTAKVNVPHTASTTQSLDMEHVRTSFVPYKPKPTVQIGSNDKIKSNIELRDTKKAVKLNPPRVRTTKAQEERAKYNQTKTNQLQVNVVKNKVPIRTNAFENTKPRYLEPRPCKEAAKKAVPKKHFLSSSESSRNSSPVLARNIRTSRTKTKAQAMSQDSLATPSRPRTAEPSTDSLSESQTSNKYGTYTKTKHTSKGSVESVKSPKYQNTSVASAINNKVKTKIPVYSNNCTKAGIGNLETKEHNVHKRYAVRLTNNAPTTSKTKTDRKMPGSLMMATKSSSAKVVPKVVKESQIDKTYIKRTKSNKPTTKQEEQDRPVDIPVMGRSGTFLKDEPMFADKTTEFDVGP